MRESMDGMENSYLPSERTSELAYPAMCLIHSVLKERIAMLEEIEGEMGEREREGVGSGNAT